MTGLPPHDFVFPLPLGVGEWLMSSRASKSQDDRNECASHGLCLGGLGEAGTDTRKHMGLEGRLRG